MAYKPVAIINGPAIMSKQNLNTADALHKEVWRLQTDIVIYQSYIRQLEDVIKELKWENSYLIDWQKSRS